MSRFCVWWSLINASMQGLAFMVFNCSMLRFGVIIALMEGVQAGDTSCHWLGVLQRSRDISLSSLVDSFFGHGHLHSIRIVPALCMPKPNSQILSIGSTFSLLSGRVQHCRCGCVRPEGRGQLAILPPPGYRTKSQVIRVYQLRSCLFSARQSG